MQDISETEGVLQELHQQLALIKEAEAQGPNNHSLYKLPSHHEAYHKTQEAMVTARKEIDELVIACEKHIESYKNIVETQQCIQWLNEITKTATAEENVRIFDLVKEFLHNAGKDDVVAQCETSEQEVFQLSQHLNLGIRKCLQIYTEYFSILSQCPKTYLQNHRVYVYLQWVRFLLQMKNSQSCDVVFEKLKDFHDSTKILNSAQVVNVALSLDTLYKENLMQVNKLFEELATIRTKDVSTSLEKMYSNAKAGVATFLAREKGAASAMEFVIASELVLLNRNLLTLEVAAQRSGDWLIKLTSRDGDWFLDDLLLNSARAVEIIGNLPPRQNYDEKFYKVLNGIKISSNIYQGLYDLNFNFHTIIMPETMKKIQCDEPTVLQMIFDVNKLIVDIGLSISDMILQLEKLLTCVLMQMDVNTAYEYVLERTAFAKKRFQMLIPNQNESLTQGQMLLMGFNGLFDKLNQEINNLVATLGDLEIPKSWKKLDHVKEAKSIAPHIFHAEVRAILEDIFLLKRIKTISEFFVLAQETCVTLKGMGSNMLLTDDQLAKPVKQFIAEFISRNILGIIPENITYAVCFLLQKLGLDITHEIEQKDIGAESKVPLDDLYTKAWNVLLKEGVFSQNVLSQASSLESNLKLAWEKLQEPKKIEQKLTLMQSSTMRLRSQLAVHNVMFDEILTLRNFASIRAKFIVDIQAEVASLQAVYRQLIEALTKQQSLIEKAYQRLNWAKGANPNVGEISAAFEAAVQARNSQLASEQKIANNILSSYATILHHELLRSSTLDVTKEYDKRFLACFEKWRLACQYMDTKTENLLPAEEHILNALTPELANDMKWLQKISETITDNISISQNELKMKKERIFIKIDELMSLTDNLKSLYNVHCKLMSDVKGLLKTITKVEEYSAAALYYVHQYKLYTDHFVDAIAIFKKDMSFEEVQILREHLEYVRAHTRDIYDDLLRLESVEGRRDMAERAPLQQLEDKELALAKQDSMNGNGGKGQQRNAYAVNVWRRVKMKLEGRDPDPGRKCTVQEQVEYVIREASSLDNLALLYEGWTPWV
ncbi:unnamed protein product [Acanthoscelides obtectus]|nr:unnamed protein product [Acanthoscelides obtectus]CAK1625560.1 Serine/threonine-protein kinase SMG1 [Acanthoscelides obtectus]